MPTASRHRTLARLHAATGAPALVLGWAPALWVVAGMPGRAAHSWLPSEPELIAWWLIMALSALSHAVLGLMLWRSANTDGREGRESDEGRPLRLATGVLTLAAGVALLTIMAPATFGQASAAEAYQALDACLAVLPGLGLACVAGAAGGLYVADELPRALRAFGGREGSAQRATYLFSLALGAVLFAVSMLCVSHFSVGGAPLGASAEVAP